MFISPVMAIIVFLFGSFSASAASRLGDMGVEQQLVNGGNLQLGKFTLNKRAKISLVARILSVRDYRDMPQSQIAPTDVVLCWSDQFDSKVDIHQSDRWYYASPKKLLGEGFFSTTANFHLVGLKSEERPKLKKGSKIAATGWLVDISSSGGFFWKTSLTRHDRGSGACELFLPEEIKIIHEYAER